MSYDSVLSPRKIAFYLNDTPEAKKIISDYVDELFSTGVVEVFINPEKLEEAIAELRKRNVLNNKFANIKFYSKDLRANLINAFINYLSEQMAATNISDYEILISLLNAFIDSFRKPENIYDTYHVIFTYTSEISNYLFEAIKVHCENTDDDFTELILIVLAGLPSSVKPNYHCGYWVATKFRTFEKVDFSQILSYEPFEEAYYVFFGDEDKTPTGYSKERIHRDVIYYFKCFLIDDVFQVIRNSKKRTSKNISEELDKMYKTRKIYIYTKYLRAFFLTLLEEYERANRPKIEHKTYTVPATIDSRHKYFPS